MNQGIEEESWKGQASVLAPWLCMDPWRGRTDSGRACGLGGGAACHLVAWRVLVSRETGDVCVCVRGDLDPWGLGTWGLGLSGMSDMGEGRLMPAMGILVPMSLLGEGSRWASGTPALCLSTVYLGYGRPAMNELYRWPSMDGRQ